MAPKHKHKRNPEDTAAPSPPQSEQPGDLEEYGPIFFHKEGDNFGFFSNFYPETFKAPHPATWLFERPETVPSVLPSGNAHAGPKAPETATFQHSEQYYMYCKAIYFGDEDAARRIMSAGTATGCKAAGRSVKGFSDKAWEKHDLKVRVMEEALWWKLGGGQLEGLLEVSRSNPDGQGLSTKEGRMETLNELGRKLLATGERQLVEAAGRDKYWGIGFSMKDGPHLWEESWGRNQLGKSLMSIRERLTELVDGEEEEPAE